MEIEMFPFNEEEEKKWREIIEALMKSGGLSGVKGGVTEIHFDGDGNFQGVKLNYWTWRRRKQ